MTLKRQKGFTLIELLIVITIIGILAVALVPRLTGGQERARDAQRKADLQQIATALEFYADDDANGLYPADSSDCLPDLSSYLTTTPSDPKATTALTGGCATPDYSYVQLNGGTGYMLVAVLENTNDTGDNVYESMSLSTLESGASDISDVLGNASLSECTTACTAPMYMIGR